MRTIPARRLAAVLLTALALGGAGLAAAPAFAVDLDTARRQAQVGELPNGYAQAMSGAPADVRALVDRVNAERRQEYARIAGERGTTPEAVGAVTAGKIAEKVPAGTPVMNASGQWVTK